MKFISKLPKKLRSIISELHFLDYLIILAVALGAIILFSFFNPENTWIEIAIYDKNVPVYQAQSLKIGDFEKSPSGETIAEIIGLEIFDTPTTPTVNKDILIKSKILVKINPRSKEYEYKNKILKVGTPIELRFNNGIVSGIVSAIHDTEEDKDNSVEKIITVIVYGQYPWLADSIKIGSGEMDEGGKKVIEVLSKESSPAQVTTTTAIGDMVLRTDPQKVDITLQVKIRAQTFGDQIVFRGEKRILIGEILTFNAGITRVKDAFIISIE